MRSDAKGLRKLPFPSLYMIVRDATFVGSPSDIRTSGIILTLGLAIFGTLWTKIVVQMKQAPVKRIPIPPLKPKATDMMKGAHYGLTLLFEERGGYPAEMSAQRLADMINARLRGIPKYKATKVTRHVIERILGRRKG